MEIIKAENHPSLKVAKRNNFFFGFVGVNRTGKSVTAAKYVADWAEANPDYTIVGFDPQRRFQDYIDIEILPGDTQWAVGLHNLRNALLILDDYRLIHEKNTPIDGIEKLLYHRSDWNIDIIYIVHNPALITNLFTYYTSHYFLFYTEASNESFQKKIANYSLCMNGQRLINKYVKLNGRGEYPVFPHVMVDTEKAELFAMNFKNHSVK